MSALLRIPLELIDDHPANVRSSLDDDSDMLELVASISSHGLIQPLVVCPIGKRFRLLAGHRRKRALFLAGNDTAPCIVREGLSLSGALEIMLIENIQRKDLDPLEEAEAFDALHNIGLSQQQIAAKIGKSVFYVSQRLSFLHLSPEEQNALRSGQMGVAEAHEAARPRRNAAKGCESPDKMDRGWRPPHLTEEHSQAPVATALCDERGHNRRRRIGPACGICWEDAIRADQEAHHPPLRILEVS